MMVAEHLTILLVRMFKKKLSAILESSACWIPQYYLK